jgi:hypothetical protein
MKNRFSLYTFFINVFAGLRLGCTESHAKNITSLENYFFNFHFFLFYSLGKVFDFQCTPVHLLRSALATIGLNRCTESFFSLYTSVHRPIL